jgi:hypothetical protein
VRKTKRNAARILRPNCARCQDKSLSKWQPLVSRTFFETAEGFCLHDRVLCPSQETEQCHASQQRAGEAVAAGGVKIREKFNKQNMQPQFGAGPSAALEPRVHQEALKIARGSL